MEDNAADAEIAVHALRREHLANHVRVIESGEEALDYVFGNGEYSDRGELAPPPMVLLDLKLPGGIDGMEVLRQIRAHPRTAQVPVVVLTSSKYDGDLIESFRLGVNSYIQKPVDFGQFSNAIRKIGWYWLCVDRPAENAVNQSAS